MEEDWQRLLFFGAAQGYEDLIGVALGNGADIEAQNEHGFTPLLLAAVNGHAATVRRLLYAGANVRATPQGQTALILASQQGHTDVLRALLSYGADRKRKREQPQPSAVFQPLGAFAEER